MDAVRRIAECWTLAVYNLAELDLASFDQEVQDACRAPQPAHALVDLFIRTRAPALASGGFGYVRFNQVRSLYRRAGHACARPDQACMHAERCVCCPDLACVLSAANADLIRHACAALLMLS